jgi:hypothetical protein
MIPLLLVALSQAAHSAYHDSSASSSTYGGCTDGITCEDVAANGLVFQCRFAGQPDHSGRGKNVMMLHGFPEWSDMCDAMRLATAYKGAGLGSGLRSGLQSVCRYMPLMRLLASHGYHSVACNQRGYSPRASPDDESAYDYNLLAQDTFDIADAVNLTLGGTTFHLIGTQALCCYGRCTLHGKLYVARQVTITGRCSDGLRPQARMALA